MLKLLILYSVIVTYLLVSPAITEELDTPADNNGTRILEGRSVNEQWEFTKDVAKLIEYADELGYKLTFGEAWRHVHMQRYYVQHGLSWTMNSNHRKRRAVDLNLFIDDVYMTDKQSYAILGDYWESLSPSNRWGGRFNDEPHFERR